MLRKHAATDSGGDDARDWRAEAAGSTEKAEPTGDEEPDESQPIYSGAGVARDYWYIETDRGDLFWVFFDHRRKQWFLHGVVE